MHCHCNPPCCEGIFGNCLRNSVERKALQPYPGEREVWVVTIGVILFALAIAIIIIGVSDFTK